MNLNSVPGSVIDTCASTNDLVRQLGEDGAPHGSWISARSQTSGRGRLGRQWHSIEGNLFLSILVRPTRPESWTWVPIASAVSVASGLKELFPEAAVQVKWPNDLWLGRKKLGGILCEAVGSPGRSGSFIVIGVGLNCTASPQGLDQETASLSEYLKRRIMADDVREKVIRSIVNGCNQDPEEICRAYEKYSALVPGTAISWAEGTFEGKVLGLGPSGELRVVDPSGEQRSLFAEDVKVRLL